MCPWQQTPTALGQDSTVLKMTCPPKADRLHEIAVWDRIGREASEEGKRELGQGGSAIGAAGIVPGSSTAAAACLNRVQGEASLEPVGGA